MCFTLHPALLSMVAHCSNALQAHPDPARHDCIALWQDGPVAYFLAEVAYRPLRYKDDEYAWITSQGINWGCEWLGLVEQTVGM